MGPTYKNIGVTAPRGTANSTRTTPEVKDESPGLVETVVKGILGIFGSSSGRQPRETRPTRPVSPPPPPSPPPLSQDDQKRIRAAAARIYHIRSQGAPSSLDEFFARAGETVSDLRSLAATYPRVVTSDITSKLDNIEKAMKLLADEGRERAGGGGSGGESGGGSGGYGGDGGGGGGGGWSGGGGGGGWGGDGGGDGGEPWHERFAKAVVAAARELGRIADRVVDAIASGLKTSLQSFMNGVVGRPPQVVEREAGISQAWSDFWHVSGKVTVTVVLGWVGGVGF